MLKNKLDSGLPANAPEFPNELGMNKLKKLSLQQLCTFYAFGALHAHVSKNKEAWTKFNNPNADPEKLTEFDEKSGVVTFAVIPTGWERGSTVEKSGFATMPGSKTTDSDVARACAEMLATPPTPKT